MFSWLVLRTNAHPHTRARTRAHTTAQHHTPHHNTHHTTTHTKHTIAHTHAHTHTRTHAHTHTRARTRARTHTPHTHTRARARAHTRARATIQSLPRYITDYLPSFYLFVFKRIIKFLTRKQTLNIYRIQTTLMITWSTPALVEIIRPLGQ